jgi:hypothetical protein
VHSSYIVNGRAAGISTRTYRVEEKIFHHPKYDSDQQEKAASTNHACSLNK